MPKDMTKNNSKLLLGGDIEIDYNQVKGNLDLVDKVKEFATVSQMVEFSTMISTTKKKLSHVDFFALQIREFQKEIQNLARKTLFCVYSLR